MCLYNSENPYSELLMYVDPGKTILGSHYHAILTQ